jgi:hypothetical protein
LAKIQKGMGPTAVEQLAGKPTDTCSHVTGKAFIPFYFGSDAHQLVWLYKGQGRVVLSSGIGAGPQVTSIVYDPSEGGYCTR